MKRIRPGYIGLYESGELFGRIRALNSMLDCCSICPRRCGVNRRRGERGVCATGPLPVVTAAHPHFGEEPPLVGRGGSGTIFLTNCNLRCVFCQNHEISHGSDGDERTIDDLSSMMVRLQRQGCHNINFVTPTHQIPMIAQALPRAIENGLDVPLVYNCGGYEEAGTIRLLEGIFDIYMPDIKYWDDNVALRLSAAPGYVEKASAAVKEMQRQAGDLQLNGDGVAVRGLIIRHLVLPGGLASTAGVMDFIASEVSRDACVNIMDQYRPCFRACQYPELSRRVTSVEFDEALEAARKAGLRRIEAA